MKMILAGILMSGLLFSCSDDDSTPTNTTAQQIQQVTATAQGGNWRITSYIDSGTVETNHFTGYNFTFGNNGVLTATNGTTTYNGTWSVTESNSNDDDDSEDIDFNIVFNAQATANFLDLNDDWDLVEHTATKISLVDVSGGNGGYDYITFEKN